MNPMSGSVARDEMMRRLRTAVGNPLLAGDRAALPGVGLVGETAGETELLGRWQREFAALNGHAYGPLAAAAARDALVALLRARSVSHILSWEDAALPVPDLQQHLAAAGIDAVVHPPDWQTRSLAEADAYAAGVVGAVAGLADTGSIVLVSGAGRPRSASLVPPTLFAFLRARDIYPDLASWLQAVGSHTLRAAANVVVVTGPSRTADIELNLVIGVHGPGEIHVLLVE